MLASVRHPFRSRVAPVAPHLPALAAPAAVAVANPADRHTAVQGVMLAHRHAIHCQGV
jgi:putative hemolysin